MEQASKTYEVGRPRGLLGGGIQQALDVVVNFSLDVQPGEFVSVIGPSGCGKTTVLFLLAGIRTPSAGRLEVCARPPRDAVRDGLCSVIFQQPVLLDWLSVEENVLLPLRLRDPRWWLWPGRRGQYLERAGQLLRTVDLDAFSHYYPEKLSGGMQQRVAIARALINGPDLILADEPTGNLDSHTGEEIIELLCALRAERQTTLIIATHGAQVAARAPRVIELVDGQMRGGNE